MSQNNSHKLEKPEVPINEYKNRIESSLILGAKYMNLENWKK